MPSDSEYVTTISMNVTALRVWHQWCSLKIFLFWHNIMLAMMIDDSALSTRNTPVVLDMTVNDIVYEPLVRSDHCIK